MFKTCEYILE
jgi:hypothetical protein